MDRAGLVLQHDADVPPALFGDWLAARGIASEVVDVPGDDVPGLDGVPWIAVLGSHSSAAAAEPAWVPHEARLLREAIAADVPVLGICFGGQALSHVFGGRVERAEEPEAGWIHMDGPAEPGLPRGPWFTWHHDFFTVPPGGEELGRTGDGTQVFALRSHLAVQFHPEVTYPMKKSWMREDGRRRELEARPGALERPGDGAPEPQQLAEALLDLFLRRAGLAG
jgi:GMP synthase-like glutamine amidotransferase